MTGVTGYVGSHVVKMLLDDGIFKIRATVRSLANTKKLDPLKKAFGIEKYNTIEFVEADLLDKAALNKAIEGVNYIIHVANPLPGAIKLSDDDMIRPAKEGMLTILEAACQNQVKKLIVTSSLGAMVGGVWKRATGVHHYTEADFAPPEGADGYGQSKIAQEKVIREYIA